MLFTFMLGMNGILFLIVAAQHYTLDPNETLFLKLPKHFLSNASDTHPAELSLREVSRVGFVAPKT